jgi:PAS domain S-box-containing protein
VSDASGPGAKLVVGSKALGLVGGPFVVLDVDGAGTVAHGTGDGTTFGIDARRATGQPASSVLRDQPELLGLVRGALLGRAARASLSARGRSLAAQADPSPGGGGCTLLAIDVTATAEELSRAEDRLSEAQRIAHVGSWEWDATRNAVTWSDELYSIYGLERDEFGATYESFLERVYPDDREYTGRVIFDAFRTARPFVYDHRIVRKDGSVRMLHTRGEVLPDGSGKPARLVGCCWDVTDLHEAQREAERSLSLLRATLDSTEDGIFAVDLQGSIVQMNARALELWQVDSDLAATRDTWALIDHIRDRLADPEGFIAREKMLLADHETTALDTIRFKDGHVFERYTTPQRLGGEVVGRVCSFRDVTARERLLGGALVLAGASEVLAALDVEPALQAVARLALPRLGSACAVDTFSETGGPRRIATAALPGAEPTTDGLPRPVLAGRPSLSGSTRERSCLSVPLIVQGEVAGAITFIAPPERRYDAGDIELAEELARRAALALDNARLRRRWREALAARDEFLAIASHELRGPMASLHLAVRGLVDRVAPRREPGPGLDAREGKLVGAIDRAERRLERFVDELFDATEARADHLRFELAEMDLGEVVREVLSRAAPALARSGSLLTTAFRGPLTGIWDRARLEQVVSNLVSNAVKFGLGKPIEIRLEGDPEKARLEVADRGLGIAPERREAIFRPFEQAVLARHYGGLGLGLYIARSIVESHGGTIEVASEGEGRGSTFTVELPRRSRP